MFNFSKSKYLKSIYLSSNDDIVTKNYGDFLHEFTGVDSSEDVLYHSEHRVKLGWIVPRNSNSGKSSLQTLILSSERSPHDSIAVTSKPSIKNKIENSVWAMG